MSGNRFPHYGTVSLAFPSNARNCPNCAVAMATYYPHAPSLGQSRTPSQAGNGYDAVKKNTLNVWCMLLVAR